MRPRTPAGDLEEARAIANFLGNSVSQVAVCSIKSLIGHTLGASGSTGLLLALGSLRNQVAYPITNLDEVDADCRATGLNFVRGEVKKWKVKKAMANSFGFGGVNASLILQSYSGN